MGNDIIKGQLKTAKDCRIMINVLREGVNAVCPQINGNAFLSFPVCDNCANTNTCDFVKALIYKLQLYEAAFRTIESIDGNRNFSVSIDTEG